MRAARKPRHGLVGLERLLAAAADVRFDRVLSAVATHDRIRLLSASGPTAGSCFAAPITTPSTAFADEEWGDALAWRPGRSPGAYPIACVNWNASRDEHCGELASSPEDPHPLTCPCGPPTNVRHGEIADSCSCVQPKS